MSNAKVLKKASKPVIDFKPDDYVVYPTHGVGKVVSIEEDIIAGNRMELIVISFEHERMTLRVPTIKVKTSGIRHLYSPEQIEQALDIIKGRPRVRRTMWSRRAQEYEAKIHSGDLLVIAEVIRDLYKGSAAVDQSYSERQLFDAAFERLRREAAAVYGISWEEMAERILSFLAARVDSGKGAAAHDEEDEDDFSLERDDEEGDFFEHSEAA